MATAAPGLTWEQYQALPPEQRRRPLSVAEYQALSPQQREALGFEDLGEGAPANFPGPVFPNPNRIRPADDTDSGIPALRLPDGIHVDNGNPSPAQSLAPMARTVAAKTTGTPIALPPGAQLESAPAPIALPPGAQLETPAAANQTHEDNTPWLDREIPLTGYGAALESGVQSIARGFRDIGKGAIQQIDPRPKDDYERKILETGGANGLAIMQVYRMARQLGHTAEDATKIAGAIHDINQSADPVGTYLKVAQETSGQGAAQALTALATEGATRAVPKIPDAAAAAVDTTQRAVRAGVRGANKVLDKAPGTIGAGVGAAAGHSTGIPGGAEIGAGVGYAVGKELIPEMPKIPGEGFGLPNRVSGGPKAAPGVEEYAAEGTREAADAIEGQPSAQTTGASEHVLDLPPGAELEKPAAAPTPDTSPKAVQQKINDALGGEPLKPGVKLRQQPMTRTVVVDPATGKPEFSDVLAQNQAAKPATTAAPKMAKPAPKPVTLPEGFTPTPNSSAIRGYKYNPDAQELETITKEGSHYVHGEVTPEMYQEFEANPSAGKAWDILRNTRNAPMIAKVHNGVRQATTGFTNIEADQPATGQGALINKRQAGNRTVVVDPATGKPEFSDVVEARKAQASPPAKAAAKTPAAADDSLEAQLQASLNQVRGKGNSGGVMTTAAPADLAKRWGVNEESLAAGREQTRGMSAEQTDEYVEKLAERYRKGEPVEPILETRDANNNIIEVDGRARTIAAKRAGVERVPIIVRRLGAAVEENAPQITRGARKVTTNAATQAESTEAAGSGNAAAGEPISRSPEPSAPATPGNSTRIRVPGEDHTYQAAYQVRELSDVQPSHSGIDFQANPKYKLTNDRDYANPLNQGKVVENSGEKFDPSYHITDNPDATNGPAVIDSEGHALGGNGRTMILQRVYKSNPAGAAAYRQMLTDKAAQFGLDPKAIANMREPVLVRQIDDAELAGEGKQAAITDFNKTGTAAMTPAERAVADSRRVSQSTLDDVAGRLDHEGADATLADILRGKSGNQILEKLINDGVITPQERAGLQTGEQLTEAGAERIRKLMVARFFRDPAQIDTMPAALRSKIEGMTPSLARVDGVAGWDVTAHVQDAMQVLEEMRAHGLSSVDDLLQQKGLFGESTKYSPEAITLAKAIKTASARTMTQAAKRYAADMADAHRPLFPGTISPEQAFKEAFENPKPASRNAAAERAKSQPETAGNLF